MTAPHPQTSADAIPVKGFRTILFWPLSLDLPSDLKDGEIGR